MIKNVNSKQFVHACTNVLAIPMPDAACYYAPDISCTKVLVVATYSCRHNYKRFPLFSNKIGSLSEAGLTTCVLPRPLSFRSICSMSSLIKTCIKEHFQTCGLDLAALLIFLAIFFATFVSKSKLHSTF